MFCVAAMCVESDHEFLYTLSMMCLRVLACRRENVAIRVREIVVMRGCIFPRNHVHACAERFNPEIFLRFTEICN